MNGADIVGISIIVIFTSLGAFAGFVRGAFAFGGMFIAFKITDAMVANNAAQNVYIWTFIGIFVGFVVAGILTYGATKIHPIDSLEGVFGAAFGFMTGWGIARFIYSIFWFYLPDAAFTASIATGSMVALDIFNVAPYQWVMRISEGLRNPKL